MQALAVVRDLRPAATANALVLELPLEYMARSGENQKLETMKTIFFVLFLLCASAAFGQNVLAQPSYTQPLVIVDHPQHASQHELAQPQSLLESSSYSYAKGELPLSDFEHPSQAEPLGDIARAYRKEHALAKKAGFVREKYVANK